MFAVPGCNFATARQGHGQSGWVGTPRRCWAALPRLKKVRFVFTDGVRQLTGKDVSTSWYRIRT